MDVKWMSSNMPPHDPKCSAYQPQPLP
jgi:hypothetical protein